MPPRFQKSLVLPCLLFLTWLLLPLLSCCIGPFQLTPAQILKTVGQFLHFLPRADGMEEASWLIVSQLRLPRAVLALLCGGVLATAGAVLQGVLRNPLADPFTLGISAGAACGASLALGLSEQAKLFTFSGSALAAVAAFAGALLGLFASLFLGRARGSFAKENIILAGIAVAAFLGAVVALVKALNEESVSSIVFWLMGSLQGRGWDSIPLVLLASIPALGVMLLDWRKLDILILGDEQARLLGLEPGPARIRLLFAASFMTAACVATCGIIGFVGLVVPHITRLLLGASHGPLLFASFFGGGIFLLMADCASRSVLDGGQELPAGVVTALAGGPFFAFLVWKRH